MNFGNFTELTKNPPLSEEATHFDPWGDHAPSLRDCGLCPTFRVSYGFEFYIQVSSPHKFYCREPEQTSSAVISGDPFLPARYRSNKSSPLLPSPHFSFFFFLPSSV